MEKEQIAKILLSIKAVTLNLKEPYRYTSGILSPIYTDNRIIMSYPDKREQIVDAFIGLIEENQLKFDLIAGVATAGIPHAAFIAQKLKKPMIYIRDKSKSHGKQNQIEGRLEKGQKVLVVEDLISTGGSSFSAVEAVRGAGGIVEDCIAVFTYELPKSIKTFSEGKCNLFTLTGFSTLIETAEKEEYISEEEKQKALEWNSDSQNWGKNMGYE